MIDTVILTALATLGVTIAFAIVSVTRARHSAHRVDALREDEERVAHMGCPAAGFTAAPPYEATARQA